MKKLVFVLILFSLNFSFESLSQIPSDGLVAYYPFNGNANDESGNGNNGLVNGAILTIDRFGENNSAYNFNGTSDFIEVPDSQSLKDMDEISISAWVNIDSWYQSGGQGYFPIIHKSDLTQWGMYAVTLRELGGISHLKQEENGFIYNDWQLGSWFHVVSIFANNTNKIYINGELINDAAAGVFPNSFNSNLPLIIGMDSPGLLEYSDGSIDDIGIWNRALSEAEVLDVYNDGTLATEGSLKNKYLLHPNPAEDLIKIKFNDWENLKINLSIYNSLSQLVLNGTLDSESGLIDISMLKSGMYFLQLRDDKGRLLTNQKLIIK